nr:putative ribonuclease H-like domain-containing protein [Tanacetum cinerariifolium]
MTLIEATRTILADLLLPIPFWAKTVNTACYVQNRVLVTKPYNKTPFELLPGRTPSIGFMRPFGCPMNILNTLDPLGKFDGKADEGFLVGYSISRSGPTWLFDIDTLTKSMNYQPVIVGNQPNPSVGSKDPQNSDNDVTFEVKEPESEVHVSPSSSAKTKKHDDKTKREAKGKIHVEFAVGPSNTVVSPTLRKSSYVDPSQYLDDLDMPALEDITYSDDEDDVGAEADFSNLETSILEEGIDYKEVFAPVARIEAIRLFLAYASFMGFMDLKTPIILIRFRKWPRGKIDQTLFIKKQKGNILLVHVYVDDIIFGSTNKDLCKAFEKLMKDKFQMSLMGELTFLLGLKVKQK